MKTSKELREEKRERLDATARQVLVALASKPMHTPQSHARDAYEYAAALEARRFDQLQGEARERRAAYEESQRS